MAQQQVRLTEEFTATADLLRRSTVHVRSGRWGGGSGVIWSPDGTIITNAHVARGPSAAVELFDGRKLDAEVISSDARRDLAALRVEASSLPAAPIGDSDALRIGQLVVAVGNPLGLSGALTVGIVHAIAPTDGTLPWVQADVRLAPGNSGGPLADVQGRVVGINSMISGGLGLAVPSNDVQRFLHAEQERPLLGIVSQPVAVEIEKRRVAGLLVLETASGSPAEAAGLTVGDVLIGAGGQLFQDPRELGAALQTAGAGGTLELEVLRGGQRIRRRAQPALRRAGRQNEAA